MSNFYHKFIYTFNYFYGKKFRNQKVFRFSAFLNIFNLREYQSKIPTLTAVLK